MNFGYVPSKIYLYKRDTKNFDRENFLLDLLDIDWSLVIKLEKEDPNYSFNLYENTLNILLDKYIPLRKITQKELKQQYKPWITNNILKSIKARENLNKKFIKAKDEKSKEDYFKMYKELRNKILTKCRNSKKTYFQNFFFKNANNLKNMWTGINSLINVNNNIKQQPTSLLIKNKLISDHKEVAETFNNYFSSVASHHYGQDYSSYLNNRNAHNFFISPTEKIELIDIINTFSITKATGPHSIPSDISHLIKLNVVEPLESIINLSFGKGIYIENLKISKTIPVYKMKGSPLDYNNYRPISLLSNINKLIEKLMYKRLYTFLSKHNCIYELQFGFRNGHSTNHALLDLTEDIRNALDNNIFVVGIFIDLQKAFNTVDHNIRLKKT